MAPPSQASVDSVMHHSYSHCDICFDYMDFSKRNVVKPTIFRLWELVQEYMQAPSQHFPNHKDYYVRSISVGAPLFLKLGALVLLS